KANVVKPGDILVCDLERAHAEAARKRHPGLTVCAAAAEVAAAADTVILAVKPKDVQPMLQAIARSQANHASRIAHQPLFLSIAAGITLAQLQTWLGGARRIIRVMPNTPAQIGRGYSAFARAEGVGD